MSNDKDLLGGELFGGSSDCSPKGLPVEENFQGTLETSSSNGNQVTGENRG